MLVLTGAGGVSFCAGADLKATDTMVGRLMSEEGPMGFTRLTASKPTIAAISGFCLAGGLEIALWCDLRIATEGSTLGYPERRWGVPLIDGGTQRLPRIVGLGRALDLILTGRMIDAREALAMGLLTEVVPPGAHLERALALAEGLSRFPQRTMLADRRAAIEGFGMPLADAASRPPPARKCSRTARAGRSGTARGGRERVFAGRRWAAAEPVLAAARSLAFKRQDDTRSASCTVVGAVSSSAPRRLTLGQVVAVARAMRDGLLRHRSDRLHRTPAGGAAAGERQGDVYVLVRDESTGRLDDLVERWSLTAGARRPSACSPCIGDLRRPLLGVEKEQVEELRGKIEHFFHLAAVYDMTAPAERNTAVNVGGTTHAVELARALDAKHLHHVSSIAVAGTYKGVFGEDMFDEGQRLPSPYHRTKYESERIVREQPYIALARVPAGDRRRRLADRRDGQDRRPVLLLQGDPADAPAAARVGAARRARPRLHEHRARRLGRGRARAHRARA